MKAITNEVIPWLMDSCPNVGPTNCSETICAGAGILPVFSTLARSRVSSSVKCPVIEETPPVISFCTVGALYTYPSSTMAMARFTFFLVKAAQRRAPSEFIVMLTHGRPFCS